MKKSSGKMRWLLAAVAAGAVAAWLLMPAKKEVKRYVANAGDGYTTPTMSTADVSTLISDSGYTRYHVEAPLWQMFEDADDPFWRFPLGIELEQYDLAMNPESTVTADSAIYYSRKRLWRLDGNVVMVNTSADSFLTQQLFWDQNSRKIYSDSFIHIVRTDRTIEGYGFESDQSMEYYTVTRPTAILPADRRPGSPKP
ncbi:MAG: LPS export ABC transporter periplasmic protein LptC, partial [Muribaculaceae bacterium]|nr:LPS export ABC transporter periplasmic protein LptC [Muribaculaceae bacterium]